MKIERKIITIAELVEGFIERDDDSVTAYGRSATKLFALCRKIFP